MYIKIQAHDTSKGIVGIVEYLDKENVAHTEHLKHLDKQNDGLSHNNIVDREFFFNSSTQEVSKLEVVEQMGKNIHGLRKNDPKFFMITISPSVKELKHLKSVYEEDMKAAMKDYTVDVMRGYALVMNREIESRKMEEKDLVWYGIYEKDRKYGHRDNEVLHNREYRKWEKGKPNIFSDSDTKPYFYVLDKDGKTQSREELLDGDRMIKEKMIKPGENGHVHVVIHRRDKSGKLSLSPLSKSKGGKTTVITRYYDQGKRISKKVALEISKAQGRELGESSVEIRREKVQIGFNRNLFKEYCEGAFDYKFDYKRELSESFRGASYLKKDPNKYLELAMEKVKRDRGIKLDIKPPEAISLFKDASDAINDPEKLILRLVSKGLNPLVRGPIEIINHSI